MSYVGIQGNSASKQIFERNPLSKKVEFTQNNVGPHGSTIRATYTVPSNKLAQIGLITGLLFRKQVASALDNVIVKFEASIAGRLLTFMFRQNAVGDQVQESISRNKLLESGEIIEIETEDDSTGGQINYALNVAITEFDLN